MRDDICTIPISEAFEAYAKCPFCEIEKRLCERNVEYILGPAMMEPDVRIETNKYGFCRVHFDKMIDKNERLPLLLILSSHLKEKSILPKQIKKQKESCFVCQRIDSGFNAMLKTFFKKIENDSDFLNLFKSQKGICFTHHQLLCIKSKEYASKRNQDEFNQMATKLCKKSLKSATLDIDLFADSFDYRKGKNKKDIPKNAIEDAIDFLLGKKN